MNYTMIYKSSFGLLIGCLLMAGQSAQAQVPFNPAEQSVQVQTKNQESRLSTLKKRVFSTAGAVVVLGVCCCALSYWCLQLHKGNVALAEEAKLAGANFSVLSGQVDEQVQALVAVGDRVTAFQKLVRGRFDQLESALYDKNNDAKLAGEITDAASVNRWSQWFDKTASGTQFEAVQVPASPLEQQGTSRKDDCNIQ